MLIQVDASRQNSRPPRRLLNEFEAMEFLGVPRLGRVIVGSAARDSLQQRPISPDYVQKVLCSPNSRWLVGVDGYQRCSGGGLQIVLSIPEDDGGGKLPAIVAVYSRDGSFPAQYRACPEFFDSVPECGRVSVNWFTRQLVSGGLCNLEEFELALYGGTPQVVADKIVSKTRAGIAIKIVNGPCERKKTEFFVSSIRLVKKRWDCCARHMLAIV